MSGDLSPGDGVRPTIRCLTDDLDLGLPTADKRLDDIDHPLISKAQQVPEAYSAGGAKRIVSVSDRVWLKVKVTEWRGAATELNDADAATWWLGAAGHRKDDSPQSDFYSLFEVACDSAGKSLGLGSPNSDQYLPTADDFDRITLENAYLVIPRLRRSVLAMAKESIRDGYARAATFDTWELVVLVRADGGSGADAYIAIGGEGLTNERVFAAIFDAIPGIGPDDWMMEPSTPLALPVRSGQLVYSALLSPEVQAELFFA